ncbi:LysR family transcriptional regulator [Rhodobaculum claviforme]|uniref:LysR family transcriptional regulator n=1 Tax=Rhodobaculum claviforme TaxID=1549854 RepID=A0A934WHZ5_9RHOB|nr:LysR family transcriptional regulator [Rhodobaculum claviforme]MBK5926311.1 LysR family transcriptional regulator [Rhodobaculum claviforme]
MDRLTEMEAFATVVDQGGFTDAARKLGISKSAVSKHVSALEARLGARLLNRTTRRVSPTEIGLIYYDRARRVITQAGEADALVSAMQKAPSGVLRVAVAADFGAACLAPLLAEFLRAYPEVTLDVVLGDGPVEMISEGFDVAIRVGPLEDSSLRVRRIARTALRLVAAPGYLQAHGWPMRIEDLTGHRLLHASSQPSDHVWRIAMPTGERRQIRGTGRVTINDGAALLDLAVAGFGIARLPGFLCGPALRNGRLREVLSDLPREDLAIHALTPPGRFPQPKSTAFVDFLATRFATVPPDSV